MRNRWSAPASDQVSFEILASLGGNSAEHIRLGSSRSCSNDSGDDPDIGLAIKDNLRVKAGAEVDGCKAPVTPARVERGYFHVVSRGAGRDVPRVDPVQGPVDFGLSDELGTVVAEHRRQR
jgi:hypothetical protein